MKKVSSHVVLLATCMVIAMLLIPTPSEARVVSVQLSAPTIAFGGYSWPGVGQYEKITGVAYAEVDPNRERCGLSRSTATFGLRYPSPTTASRSESGPCRP